MLVSPPPPPRHGVASPARYPRNAIAVAFDRWFFLLRATLSPLPAQSLPEAVGRVPGGYQVISVPPARGRGALHGEALCPLHDHDSADRSGRGPGGERGDEPAGAGGRLMHSADACAAQPAVDRPGARRGARRWRAGPRCARRANTSDRSSIAPARPEGSPCAPSRKTRARCRARASGTATVRRATPRLTALRRSSGRGGFMGAA